MFGALVVITGFCSLVVSVGLMTCVVIGTTAGDLMQDSQSERLACLHFALLTVADDWWRLHPPVGVGERLRAPRLPRSTEQSALKA